MRNNTVDQRFSLIFVFCLVMLIAISLLSGCSTTHSDTGRLRGDIISLRLPIRNGVSEGIIVGKDHIVARFFAPVNSMTKINNVVIGEPLWTDLETLRASWCQQLPTFVSHTPDDAAYRVVFECHVLSGLPNPVNYVQPADLPAPLQALIDLVPSTAERLLPQ